MTGIFEGMCFFMENRRDHVSSGERERSAGACIHRPV